MTTPHDRRLYLPHAVKEWSPRVMAGYSREYCHSKFADDPHYHLLVEGEVYLDNGEQKYCLECGSRMGLLTSDRLFWQKERAGDVTPPREGSTGESEELKMRNSNSGQSRLAPGLEQD